MKEIQRRFNDRGYDTGGIDGRTGSQTIKACSPSSARSGCIRPTAISASRCWHDCGKDRSNL